MTLIKPRPPGYQEFFYVWNFLHSCILILVSFPDTYFKIMWPQAFRFWAHVTCQRSVLMVVNILFVCGALGNFPLKKFCTEKNAPTFCHKNSMAWGCVNSPKLNLSNFTWIQNKSSYSTQLNQKAIITTKVFSFLWKKKLSPFSLNFVTRPNSSHTNQWWPLQTLKKNHPC